MAENEEIDMSKIKSWHVGVMCLIFGVLLGCMSAYYYETHTDYRSPEEIAKLLEGMLFNHTNMEDITQIQLRVMLLDDSTSLAALKSAYIRYDRNDGFMHELLKNQVNNICFKKEFKFKCGEKCQE